MLEHPQGVVATGDLLGRLGQCEEFLALVEHQDQGVRQPDRHPCQDVRQHLRIAAQRPAKRGIISRLSQGLVEHLPEVHRVPLAVRRVVAQ